MARKRGFQEVRSDFKKNKKRKTVVSDGSNEEVLLMDVKELLRESKAFNGIPPAKDLPEHHVEIDLTISRISSTGDGLAEKGGQVYIVPFGTPGDTVTARVYKHFNDESYTLTDLIKVVQASQHRTEEPRCQYFTKCSGCQFQHLSYSYQLAHKKTVVEKAYRNFSNLPTSAIPPVGDTVGSPLVYGYRTKLTPHFDGPPGGRRDKRKGVKVTWSEVPPIGFMQKGTRKTVDIEDCPIGTDSVRLGLTRERSRVAKQIDSYQKGATILLREHTERLQKDQAESKTPDELQEFVTEDQGEYLHRKTCISDSKATSTEYVDDFRFDNPAGAFFQNNNSILPVVTQYIRDQILGHLETNETGTGQQKPKIKNMIDAYCGSGFFTVVLSSMFDHSIGIDISHQSIEFAIKNAQFNQLPPDSTQFIAADANALFGSVDQTKFPPDDTVVVIDPPRKGCDVGFISQLLAYGPARICYVSCNVHTQARDVGWLVGGLPESDETQPSESPDLYEIESLRGFDFFPQTSHVEGVAILRRKTG